MVTQPSRLRQAFSDTSRFTALTTPTSCAVRRTKLYAPGIPQSSLTSGTQWWPFTNCSLRMWYGHEDWSRLPTDRNRGGPGRDSPLRHRGRIRRFRPHCDLRPRTRSVAPARPERSIHTGRSIPRSAGAVRICGRHHQPDRARHGDPRAPSAPDGPGGETGGSNRPAQRGAAETWRGAWVELGRVRGAWNEFSRSRTTAGRADCVVARVVVETRSCVQGSGSQRNHRRP